MRNVSPDLAAKVRWAWSPLTYRPPAIISCDCCPWPSGCERECALGALGVFAVAGQAHSHTWRCGIVPVDQRRPLEAADHGIEIAVVVEVAKRHAVAVVVKSPPGTDLLEARIAKIPVGDVGRVERREKKDRLLLLGDRDLPSRPIFVLGVEVVGVELKPIVTVCPPNHRGRHQGKHCSRTTQTRPRRKSRRTQQRCRRLD